MAIVHCEECDRDFEIPELVEVACLQYPKCDIMINGEEIKCQLSDKLQEEEK